MTVCTVLQSQGAYTCAHVPSAALVHAYSPFPPMKNYSLTLALQTLALWAQPPPIPSAHLLLSVSSATTHYFLHTVAFSSFGKMSPDLLLFPPQPEGTSLDSVPYSVALSVCSQKGVHRPERGHAQLANGKATGDTTEGPFQILYLNYKKSLQVNLPITVGAVVIVFVQAHRKSPAISSLVRSCTHQTGTTI